MLRVPKLTCVKPFNREPQDQPTHVRYLRTMENILGSRMGKLGKAAHEGTQSNKNSTSLKVFVNFLLGGRPLRRTIGCKMHHPASIMATDRSCGQPLPCIPCSSRSRIVRTRSRPMAAHRQITRPLNLSFFSSRWDPHRLPHPPFGGASRTADQVDN